jgi:ribonuclease HII
MRRVHARRTIENALRRFGFVRVAGVDEVGRGCLAGPVMAGAVILDPGRHIPGLADSKAVPAAERERLYDLIVARAAGWAVAAIEPTEIDTLNIHHASLKAMRVAVLGLAPLPDAVVVDAFHIPGLPVAQRSVVGGDRQCAAIAAASIVAKVTRDRLMQDLHAADPRYGFDRHKGYATAEHLAALARFGYSVAHRRSFRPPSLFEAAGMAAEAGVMGVTDQAAARERDASGAAGPADRQPPGPRTRVPNH